MHGWLVQGLLALLAAELCVRFASLSMCVCMWARPFALPIAWQLDQAASVLLDVWAMQWGYCFSGSDMGSEGGLFVARARSTCSVG